MKENILKNIKIMQKGITLISLVITIIVLVLLAGVSINMLSGQNSIINKSGTAKQETIIANEKDQIVLAWNALILDKTTGKIENINEDNFENELNKSTQNTKVDYVENDVNNDFLVTFEDTTHEYIVKKDGSIVLNTNDKTKDELTIDNYVKEGLILWYDGIQNTRSGNNPNATSWEDLSGNNNDGIFSNAIVANQNDITASSKGYYDINENGYVFWHNDAYIESKNNLGISGDDNFTIELVITPYQVGKNQNFPTGYVASCPIWLGTPAWDNYGTLEFGYEYQKQKIEYGFINNPQYVNDQVNILNKINALSYRKDKIGTIRSGGTGLFKIMLNNNELPNTYSGREQYTNLVNAPVHLGRDWQWGSQNRTMYGTLQAVRIYNRTLTDEEIYKNYKIDRNRYGILDQEEIDYINETFLKNSTTIDNFIKNKNKYVDYVLKRMKIFAKNEYAMNKMIESNEWRNAILSNNRAIEGLDLSEPITIPIMTSNTTPEGEAFASSSYTYSSILPYRIFDGTTSGEDYWNPGAGVEYKNQFVGYSFLKEIWPYKIEVNTHLRGNKSYFGKQKAYCIIEATNNKDDESSWTALTDEFYEGEYTFIINNTNKYKHYRLRFTRTTGESNQGGSGNTVVYKMQIYGK